MKLNPIYEFVILVILISIPLFAHLNEVPIQLWDEGKVAIKSLEMSTNGNWLVATVRNMPDMISVKPPLINWIQVLFIKIIGPDELAIRLPSAIAAWLTCMLIYWFFTRKYNEPWLGVISCLVLITSQGLVTLHGARSGDYDALLTLFTTSYLVFYFLYLETQKRKYLALVFIVLILTFYTKDIQGLIFIPGLLLYTAYRKQLRFVFLEKWFYAGIALFVLLAVAYYRAEESYNPGFIKAVLENNIGSRFGSVLEHHLAPPWYYFDWIATRAFDQWYLLLLPGLLIGLASANQLLRRLTAFLLMTSLTYLVVISSAQTKLWWYVMPLCPMLSVFVAIFINSIFKLLGDPETWKLYSFTNLSAYRKYNALPYIFLIMVFVNPYKAVLNVTLQAPPKEQWSYINKDMSEYLKLVLHRQTNVDGAEILDCEQENLVWYAEAIEKQHIPVQFNYTTDYGHPSKIIACLDGTKRAIESRFDATKIDSMGDVVVYKIEERK